MSVDLEQLFSRLPAVHRLRDYDEGGKVRGALDVPHSLEDASDFGPLKSLLSVMLREGQIVAEDINQLYDDHFIETAAPWLVPYIGALVGASSLEDIGDTQSARQWVAATIALRQRKGTLAALEAATRAATGWPVVAVEYWSRIATTQSMRRVRIVNQFDDAVSADYAWELRDEVDQSDDPVPQSFRNLAGTADLERVAALDRVGTAFDTTPRSAELGRIAQGMGRWNLPNIGLHLCRKEAVSIGSPYAGEAGPETLGHRVEAQSERLRQYFFSPLRGDQPMFQRPALRNHDIDRRSEEEDLPIPITRRMLHDNPARYLGHSFNIFVTTSDGLIDLRPSHIKAANLASRAGQAKIWGWAARKDVFLIDPELGRFVLPANLDDVQTVEVYWHFGRAHAIGGHERSADMVPVYENNGSIVFPASTLIAAADIPGYGTGTKVDKLTLTGSAPQLVATEGASPTIDLGGRMVRLAVEEKANVLISGLRFINGRLILGGLSDAKAIDPSYRFEDCTLVERASVNDPHSNAANWYALFAENGLSVTLERTIIDGSIFTKSDVDLTAIDCILRARRITEKAIFRGRRDVGQTITLIRTTVHGRLDSFQISGTGLADQGGIDVAGVAARCAGISDSLIYTDPDESRLGVNITATQEGCLRYSLIPSNARAPRRYRCLPKSGQDDRDVLPHFESTDIRHPGFMQLTAATSQAVLTGGENGSEMGVGNRLLTTARLKNLDRTTREFLRFGYSAGPIFET